MLQVEGVDQFYGESHILRGVNLAVEAGGCTCVMGRNGVGKTTLVKAIMGLLPLRSGRVLFENRDITGLATEDRARAAIGYVPQGRMIFPRLTVRENLTVPLTVRGRDAELPALLFELFPILESMADRRGGDLSGGQQQQLALARALVLNPRLLILDEPFEGIQPNVVAQIGTVVRRLNRELGMTILLVEQKLPYARRVANHFSIMERGTMVASGPMGGLSDELIDRHLKL